MIVSRRADVAERERREAQHALGVDAARDVDGGGGSGNGGGGAGSGSGGGGDGEAQEMPVHTYLLL